MISKLLIVILAVLSFFSVRLYLLGRKSQTMPVELGAFNGALKPCADKPNCVSTSASPGANFIEPFSYSQSRADLKKSLISIISDLQNAKIVENENDYIHAEIRSKLFGFVDDLELYFPEGRGVLQMRSASRVGHSDLGVNRKRLEFILGRLKNN